MDNALTEETTLDRNASSEHSLDLRLAPATIQSKNLKQIFGRSDMKEIGLFPNQFISY